MKLAAERISHIQALEALGKQTDDLEYSIMAYGVAEFWITTVWTPLR